MKPVSLLESAHQFIKSALTAGDVAIDATLGNGYDTLFLAHCVGDRGHVYGFDVQIQAIQATRQRLMAHDLLERVSLNHACHSQMETYVNGAVKAIMFNLGYLPGADKHLITRVETTLRAVAAGCRLLAKEGVMTVLAYPGHPGGDLEADELQLWVNSLDVRSFQVELILSHHQSETAPRLFVIRALRDLVKLPPFYPNESP